MIKKQEKLKIGSYQKKRGWLLVPYLLWVSFAIVLNYLSV